MAIVKISGLGAGGGGGAGVVVLGSGTGSSERCGNSNTASGNYSTALGKSNTANADCSTVSGGYNNTASGYYSTVSGGYDNGASGNSSTVSGGYSNVAIGVFSTVSGGQNNSSCNAFATISGGIQNTATAPYSTISGGYLNTVSGYCSTVSGGFSNIVSGNCSTIVGGSNNSIASLRSMIVGSFSSIIENIGGGHFSIISATDSTISNTYGLGKIPFNNIIGGANHIIDSSSSSTMINGDSNCIIGEFSGGSVRNIILSSFNSSIRTYCGSNAQKNSVYNSDFSCISGSSNSSISHSRNAFVTQSSYSSVTNSSYYTNIQTSSYSSISNSYSSSINTGSQYATILSGNQNTISCAQDSTILYGSSNCIAQTRYSMANGECAYAINYGQRSFSNGTWTGLGVLGGSQQVEFIQRNVTTDATATILYSDQTTQEITLRPDSQMLLNIFTQGVEINGGSATSQDYVVVQRIGATPASIIHQDNIKQHFTTGGLDITIITNPLTNTLNVSVQGEIGKSYYWTSYIFGVENVMPAP